MARVVNRSLRVNNAAWQLYSRDIGARRGPASEANDLTGECVAPVRLFAAPGGKEAGDVDRGAGWIAIQRLSAVEDGPILEAGQAVGRTAEELEGTRQVRLADLGLVQRKP